MKILVDTSVWSQVLRRNSNGKSKQIEGLKLLELIQEQRVEIIGPVRQELLSGIRANKQFLELQEKLRAFVDLDIQSIDYERAAEMANICRGEGVQGSHIDFLICSVSERYHLSIFTTDRDFILYAKHLPILLFK